MNAVAERTPSTELVAFNGASAGALLLSETAMARIERVADLMASGKTTVPQHLRGSKGDCFAVCLQSMQWGMNPFAVAQKTHLVNGTLGYEAQLVAAVINNSGVVKDRFHFEWFGPWEKVVGKFQIKKGEKGEFRAPGWTLTDEEGCGIKVWATLKGEAQPRVLELLLAQARVRNSTLWADDPKQQLAYLAQKRWSRLYAPDVILGVYSPEEFEQPAERFMGMAEEVKPKTYDQAKFEANLPEWTKVIESGRKTAEAFIQFAATRGEPYTEEQQQVLRAIKVNKAAGATDVEPKTPPPPPVPATEPMTYAQVADRITKAQSLDDLKGMDELIGAVTDAQQRGELTALLAQRHEELPF